MERCKKSPSGRPGYPDIKAFMRRYGRRATAGVVAGVVAATAGCDWLPGVLVGVEPKEDTGYHIDGMIADTAETWSLVLGPHDLYFAEPYGWVQYRLELQIEGTALYAWLHENAEAALVAADAALQADDVTAYEHDDGYDTAEQRIVRALVQAYTDAGGVHGDILYLELIVEHYEDEDDILGDMEQTK